MIVAEQIYCPNCKLFYASSPLNPFNVKRSRSKAIPVTGRGDILGCEKYRIHIF
jgi:hypothetical protein